MSNDKLKQNFKKLKYLALETMKSFYYMNNNHIYNEKMQNRINKEKTKFLDASLSYLRVNFINDYCDNSDGDLFRSYFHKTNEYKNCYSDTQLNRDYVVEFYQKNEVLLIDRSLYSHYATRLINGTNLKLEEDEVIDPNPFGILIDNKVI